MHFESETCAPLDVPAYVFQSVSLEFGQAVKLASLARPVTRPSTARAEDRTRDVSSGEGGWIRRYRLRSPVTHR